MKIPTNGQSALTLPAFLHTTQVIFIPTEKESPYTNSRDAQGNTLSTYTSIVGGAFTQESVTLYGSSRLGEYRPNEQDQQALKNAKSLPVIADGFLSSSGGVGGGYFRKRGYVHYELTNHLGNVLATVTDRKLAGAATFYTADIVSLQDYYVFGMEMPDRSYNAGSYRYGYNGKEKSDELHGEGNAYDFGARINAPRLGRWLSLDPLAAKYPSMSPYNSMGNNPIVMVDPDGKEFDFSNLTTTQQSELKTALEVLKASDPYFAKVYDILNESKNIYKLNIDAKVAYPNFTPYKGLGTPGGNITFQDSKTLGGNEAANEEFFHAYQEIFYGEGNMGTLVGGSNTEFEPRFLDRYKTAEQGSLFSDMNCTEGLTVFAGSIDAAKGLNEEQKKEYLTKVEEFRSCHEEINKRLKEENFYDDPKTNTGPDAALKIINAVHAEGNKMKGEEVIIHSSSSKSPPPPPPPTIGE